MRTNPNANIVTLADLKGKSVGYVRATSSQYLLLRVIEEAGLSFDDIDAVEMARRMVLRLGARIA